ncbi:hypothetical protein BH11PSE9_BH11PSE9_15430 [soil metagenome]
MKLKMIALAAATMLASVSAMAAIAPGTSNNGELFVAVFDTAAKVSYTLDLGIRMDTFIADAQSEAGYSKSWGLALADGNFTSFLSQVNASNLRWQVMAGDNFGGALVIGQQRLLTTVRAGSSDAVIGSPTNAQFATGIGEAQFGSFIAAVNTTGSHSIPGDLASRSDYSVNGSSVNAESDAGKTYFGETGGTSPTFNSNFTQLKLDNAVGASTSFYYMERGVGSNAAKIHAVEFGNSLNSASFSLTNGANGYSLDYTLAAAVPEPGTYALMLAGLVGIGFVSRRRQSAR